MGTYPCSSCGAIADTATGCPSCGQPLEAEIVALDRTISSMQRRNRTMVDERGALLARLQGAIAIRTMLQRAAEAERGTGARRGRGFGTRAVPMDIPAGRGGRRGRGGRDTSADSPAAGMTAGSARTAAAQPTQRRTSTGFSPSAEDSPAGRERDARGRSATATREGRGGTPPRVPPQPGPPRGGTEPRTTGSGEHPHHPAHPPETTVRSVQNLVLGLGAAVMAVAVGLTPFIYTSLPGEVKALILSALTIVGLLLPVAFARRGLTTTAEWIAPLGMLLILLDAQEAWIGGLRHAGMRDTVYAGLALMIAAGAAYISHELSRLAMLRFTAVALLQPVLPLLLYPKLTDFASWAAALAAVAALDLLIALRTRQRYPDGPYLRTAVRILQEAVTGAAVIAASIALAKATTADAAIAAGTTLVAAGVIGLAAGLLFRHWLMRDVWAGVAAAAAIGGFGRMGALVLPGWGLIATSVALVATALLVRLLPAYARLGGQIAGAGAMAVTVVLVIVRGWGALVGPVVASTPAWGADLGRYAAVVRDHVHAHTGQVVAATLLTMIAGMVMAPVPWRRASLVGGVMLAAILAPGAWQLPWATAIVTAAIPALALGVFNLTAANDRESWTGVAATVIAGGYAAAIAMASPGGQAMLLLAYAIAGAIIGLAVLDSPFPLERYRAGGAGSPDGDFGDGGIGVATGVPAVAPQPTDAGEPALVDVTVAVNPETTWLRTRPWLRWLGVTWTDEFDSRAADAGWGAAALSLPGAVAAATAALAPPGRASVTAILAASFVTLAAVLTAVAMSQVARHQRTPLTIGGATLASLAVTIAAVRTDAAVPIDVAVAFILLISALVLCIAPTLNTGIRLPKSLGGRRTTLFGLDGDETAAAAVTVAAITALARVASLAAPGIVIVLMAFLVLCVAAGTRAMPEQWRAGPAAGAWIVGLGVAVGAAVGAIRAAVAVFRVNHPVWNVNPAGWGHRAAVTAGDVAQAPVALILLAVAAIVVLPREQAKMAATVTLGLALLAAPATLHTPLMGPVLFSGAGATAAGLIAARSVERLPNMVCGAVASTLFADTIAASLTSPINTATALFGSGLINALVAFTAAGTIRRTLASAPRILVPRALPGRVGTGATGRRPSARTGDRRPLTPGPIAITPDVSHLVLLGGGSLAAGMLTFAAAGGVFVHVTGHRQWTVILTAALAALSLALALIAIAARRLAPLLAYATGAVALGGVTIAFMDARHFTTAGVLAAGAAILGVVAEMVRTAVVSPQPVVRPTSRLQRIVDAGQRVAWLPRPRRAAVLLAAGPAATFALASIAATILAALVGPYRWIVPSRVWTTPPHGSAEALGTVQRLVGQPAGLATAVLLTVAAVLTAVGFGGSREALIGRCVAVVVPGVAITLLIAPYLLRAPWPYGPIAAVGVAAMCHLAVALTEESPGSDAATELRAARQIVIAIAITSGTAGIAGGLATPATTIGTLATATATGAIAALWGRIPISRISGWILCAAGAQTLALAISLDLHMRPYDAAFVVGGVAAVLLIVAALLPRLRRPEASTETLTVEVSAYAGAVLGLVLAAERLNHVAVFLAAWGAVLGIAAARPRRTEVYRSLLMWTASAHELVAWCLFMAVASVKVPEAYTLGIAAVAMVTGWIELRWHPQLSSWVTYGVALTAALGPSLAITIATFETPLRRTLLLIGAAGVTIFGAIRRQQAPVIIGGLALLGETINEIARYSTTALILVLMTIIAAVLIGVGANYEKRRRNLQRVWTVFHRMQ